MNKAIIMGRMVRDVELKQLQDGTVVCEFSVAVTRKYNKDKTDFIGCKAFRQTAEFIAKYFHKGDMIAIEGSIEIDEWTDKEGKRQHKTKINVEQVYFTGNKRESTQDNTDQADDSFADFDWEVPFK